MRKLILIAMIAMVGLMPRPTFAQTAPTAYTAAKQSNLLRVLAVTSGVIVGFAVTAVASIEMIPALGVGGLAVIGSVVGGVAGDKMWQSPSLLP